MRKIILIGAIFAVTASATGCMDKNNKYSGIWKAECEDFWGVQIKPAGDGLYAIAFCGQSGCTNPGVWAPNSRIDGDLRYQVVSKSELRIKRNDGGFLVYNKCTSDPAWKTEPTDG